MFNQRPAAASFLIGVIIVLMSSLFRSSPVYAQGAAPGAQFTSAARYACPSDDTRGEPEYKTANPIPDIYDGMVSPGARLYILAVGINEYQNPKLTLRYGRSDAEAFVRALKKHAETLFRQVITLTVYDNRATRTGVGEAFSTVIAEARPEDVFVFYYAGHGVMSGGDAKPQFYMALNEVTTLKGDNKMLEEKGLSALALRDFCAGIRARRQLLVLDACHSGGVLDKFSSRVNDATITPADGDLDLTVLASAGTTQPATEFRQLGHGVFTYALLKGLAGEAYNNGERNGRITVKELATYLTAKVPELTKYYRGADQTPNSFARGRDFALGAP